MASYPVNGAKHLLSRASAFSSLDTYAWKLPALFLAVSFLLVLVEFIWSPLEITLGEYMSWTNAVRPAVGTGWELDQEQTEADRELGRLVEEIDQRQAASATFTDWEKLPALIEGHNALSISPDRFLDLYRALPSFMQDELIAPMELLRIRSEGRWQRVIFRPWQEGVKLYLVNQQNFVLASAQIGDLFFRQLRALQSPIPTSLDDREEFMGRAFPAQVFFRANRSLKAREALAVSGDWAAGLEGNLVRVGVAKEEEHGKRALGFEVEHAGEVKVYLLYVPDRTALELFSQMMDLSLFREGGR